MRRGRWPKKTLPDCRHHLFGDDDDLWARVNNSGFALSAYAFTRDPAMRETVARFESGMVGINSYALAAAEAPFGGIKASGMGREGEAVSSTI